MKPLNPCVESSSTESFPWIAPEVLLTEHARPFPQLRKLPQPEKLPQPDKLPHLGSRRSIGELPQAWYLRARLSRKIDSLAILEFKPQTNWIRNHAEMIALTFQQIQELHCIFSGPIRLHFAVSAWTRFIGHLRDLYINLYIYYIFVYPAKCKYIIF